MDKTLDSLLKTFSVFSLLFLLMGNVYTYYYYENFNINIYEYISPTEAFALFLTAFLKIVWIIMPVLLISFLVYTYMKYRMLKDIRKIQTPFGVSRYKYKWIDTKVLWLFLITATISMIFSRIAKPYFQKDWYTFQILHFFSSIIFQLSTVFITYFFIYKAFRKTMIRNFKSGLVGAIMICSIFIARSTGDLKSLLILAKPREVNSYKFVFQNQAIVTNDSMKYVGSTNDYYFFCKIRNTDHFSTLIFKKSDIISPVILDYQNAMVPE